MTAIHFFMQFNNHILSVCIKRDWIAFKAYMRVWMFKNLCPIFRFKKSDSFHSFCLCINPNEHTAFCPIINNTFHSPNSNYCIISNLFIV